LTAPDSQRLHHSKRYTTNAHHVQFIVYSLASPWVWIEGKRNRQGSGSYFVRLTEHRMETAASAARISQAGRWEPPVPLSQVP